MSAPEASANQSEQTPQQPDVSNIAPSQLPDEVVRIIQQIHARAMVDPEFRAEYIRNPRKVLLEHKLQIPDGINFSVIDRSKIDEYTSLPKTTETHIQLVIPLADESISAGIVLSGANLLATIGTKPCTSN
ncbi:MAG TPA: hypothetical protein VFS21_06955 [Roseiflexaceae bacterium]|nr:hypothetical protein [Roseiflexaceae bacterium]